MCTFPGINRVKEGIYVFLFFFLNISLLRMEVISQFTRRRKQNLYGRSFIETAKPSIISVLKLHFAFFEPFRILLGYEPDL